MSPRARGVPGPARPTHLLERLHGEVDAATGGGQRQVLLGHSLHLLHHNVRLLHLPRHLGSLPLEVLQRCDDRVVVQDAPLDLVQSLQQRLLQLTQAQLKLPLKDQKAQSLPWCRRDAETRDRGTSSRGSSAPTCTESQGPGTVPWSFRRSDRFSSTSGLSALRTSLRHWLCRLLRVTVKLTKVTREQRSGGNSTCQEGRRAGQCRHIPGPTHCCPVSVEVGPGPYGGVSSGQEDDKGW